MSGHSDATERAFDAALERLAESYPETSAALTDYAVIWASGEHDVFLDRGTDRDGEETALVNAREFLSALNTPVSPGVIVRRQRVATASEWTEVTA